ncbi:MAG: hypothetical protein WCP69_09600 [Bacteroidota bacterium]
MKKNWAKLKIVIEKECSTYIKELSKCEKGYMLVRKVNKRNYKYDDGFDHSNALNNRMPRGMNPRIHNFINDCFFDQFKWKIRNGCFCYSRNLLHEPEPINLFDKEFIVFPTDRKIEFIYDSGIIDLTVKFQDLNKMYFELDAKAKTDISQLKEDYFQLDQKLFKKVEALNYSNQCLNSALMSTGEISLKTNFYYLVHKRYKDDLIDLIWG